MRLFSFFKKEVKEILKTYKIYVLPFIFLLFGMSSPLLTKNIKEIMKSFGEGIELLIPEQTYIDSYASFFKNIGQMGFIIMVLIFMGTVVEEKTKGSAMLVMTKGVSHTKFIISKFTAAALLFTISYVISTAACVYYTYVLFPQAVNSYLPFSILMYWVYGVLLVSLTIFASTVSRSITMSAVMAFAGFSIVSITASIPYIKKISPGALSGMAMEILKGQKVFSDAAGPLIAAAVLTVAFIIGSIACFKRQEL